MQLTIDYINLENSSFRSSYLNRLENELEFVLRGSFLILEALDISAFLTIQLSFIANSNVLALSNACIQKWSQGRLEL